MTIIESNQLKDIEDNAVRKFLIRIENLIEQLAELEHEQWRSWTKYISQDKTKSRKLCPEWWNDTFMKWGKNWKSYKNLSEQEKEKDRQWARKVLNIIERYITP